MSNLALGWAANGVDPLLEGCVFPFWSGGFAGDNLAVNFLNAQLDEL